MPGKSTPALLREVERYYSGKIHAHGATPAGVDWSGARTQRVRFEQLLRMCPTGPAGFSINDVGCGYGALLEVLSGHPAAGEIDYLGIDVSPLMVEHARRRYPNARFVVGASVPRVADFTLASGVFNVKLSVARTPWEKYARRLLTHLFECSRIALGVNFLSPAPNHAPGAAELYRPDPLEWVQFFRGQLAARVDLLTGYGLSEYTLVVRR